MCWHEVGKDYPSYGWILMFVCSLAFLGIYMTLAYYVRRFDIELVNTTAEDMRIVQDMGGRGVDT